MTQARAAELQVLAGGGIAAPLKEIAAQFEAKYGHKVSIRFDTTPELIKMATAGGSFDLAVVPQEFMKDPKARAQFASETMPTVARVGFAVAVRAGTPKPNISTPEALKRTLLAAQSIASLPASAAGAQIAAVYRDLGIADEMKAITKAQQTPGNIIDAVANGECDLAVFLVNVLTDHRLDVVGPFPAEVQREIVYTTAVASNSKEFDAAAAFITYLLGPASAKLIEAKGMIAG